LDPTMRPIIFVRRELSNREVIPVAGANWEAGTFLLSRFVPCSRADAQQGGRHD
jgi:hypothetical protein